MKKYKNYYGHPDFYKALEEEAELHSLKNYDYAAGGDPLGNFDRVAHLVDFYNILHAPYSTRTKVCIIYMFKQFDALLDSYGKGRKMKVEGHKPRIQDISVYIKILNILLEEDEKKK